MEFRFQTHGPPIKGRRSTAEIRSARLAWAIPILALAAMWTIILSGWTSHAALLGVSVGAIGLVIIRPLYGLVCWILARRRVKAGGLLLCPACWHPMIAEGDDKQVRCPECGGLSPRSFVDEFWKRGYFIGPECLRTVDAIVGQDAPADSALPAAVAVVRG